MTDASNPPQTAKQAPGPSVAGETNKPADDAAVHESRALLAGRKFALIRHNGETYRLQATRLGKLILTK